MIQSNELRIGNLVYEEAYQGKEMKVIAISLLINPPNSEQFMYPILLTEEWLLRFGYIKGAGVRWAGKGTFDLFEYRNEFTYKVSDGVELIIKTVHQLQNLFYALTGDELVIKETATA